MAECTALLRRRTFTGTGGSNPPLSASFLLKTGVLDCTPASHGSLHPLTRMRHTRRAPRTRPVLAILWLALSVSPACTGPELHIHNPGDHEVYLDGRRTTNIALKYRYYGTTRWDALPNVQVDNGVPVFAHQASSQKVLVAAPASLWLFPLDLPLEALQRTFRERPDQTMIIHPPEQPAAVRLGAEIPGEEISKLSARGRQARVQR